MNKNILTVYCNEILYMYNELSPEWFGRKTGDYHMKSFNFYLRTFTLSHKLLRHLSRNDNFTGERKYHTAEAIPRMGYRIGNVVITRREMKRLLKNNEIGVA